MLNFILNAIADFYEPLCTGLHIRFIIYLCSMYVDICFFGICSLLLLFLCLAFLSFTHLLLLLHLLNQLIITELFSISCFSRSLG